MKRHSTILIAVLILAVAPVTAQQATPEPAPAGAPDDVENVVDDEVALVDKSYANGEITLEFYASESKTITIAGEPPSGSDSGSGSISRERLRANTTTTVTIASGGGATFWTRDSMAAGEYSYERKPSSAIVSGPWSAGDVTLVGIATALAVATAVLYGAVLARLGEIEGGGRIA